MSIDYLDFELKIDKGEDGHYPVEVIHSPAGEAREIMPFPFGELDLEKRLLTIQNAVLRSGGKRRSILSPEQEAVREFGHALFNALFIGQVRSRYEVSRNQAVQSDRGLRIKLRINSPELAALPWEFLYDPDHQAYVCHSVQTPLVRYIELPDPPKALNVKPPLRILGMVANPSNLTTLDISNERQRIEDALNVPRARGIIELHWLPGETWRDLQKAMQEGPWHIFHFIGHGVFDENAGEGMVMLCDDRGKAHPFPASGLGQLLADHRTLRLVVLNSCEGATGSNFDIFSSTASMLVQRGLPAVLALQYEITDRAAIELSRTFYEAIAIGMPVDAAVTEARKAIWFAVANTLEWATPVLYMRSPDGRLFDIEGNATRETKSVSKIEQVPLISGAVEPAAPLIPSTSSKFSPGRSIFAGVWGWLVVLIAFSVAYKLLLKAPELLSLIVSAVKAGEPETETLSILYYIIAIPIYLVLALIELIFNYAGSVIAFLLALLISFFACKATLMRLSNNVWPKANGIADVSLLLIIAVSIYLVLWLIEPILHSAGSVIAFLLALLITFFACKAILTWLSNSLWPKTNWIATGSLITVALVVLVYLVPVQSLFEPYLVSSNSILQKLTSLPFIVTGIVLATSEHSISDALGSFIFG